MDHQEAVIVFLSDEGEETHLVSSASPAGSSGGPRGRYYDEVVARLGDARSVLIFGLADATREVETRLDRQERSNRVIGVGAAERMTVAEIASEVRQRFRV